MDEEQDSEDEMFVLFGSLFSDEGNFPQEKRISNEKSSRHQSHASDSFSEMWLILRISESNVLDVLFHARSVQTCLLIDISILVNNIEHLNSMFLNSHCIGEVILGRIICQRTELVFSQS